MQNINKRNTIPVLVMILMIVSAGCVGPIDNPLSGGGSDVAGEEPVDGIPSEANTVVLADPVGLVQDGTTRDLGNYFVNQTGSNETFDEQLDSGIEQFNTQLNTALQEEDVEIDLALDDIGEFVFFADSDTLEGQGLNTGTEEVLGESYAGLIFELELSEEDLTELFETVQAEVPNETDEVEFTREQYNGVPVFSAEVKDEEVNETISLAILDSGTHTVGTRDVVTDVIDTYVGDAEGVNSDLVPESTSNTYLAFSASDFDQSTFENASDEIEGVEQDPELESFLFTYSTSGSDTILVNTELQTNSSQFVTGAEDEIEAQLQETRTQVNGSDFGFLNDVIGESNLVVSSEGSELSLEYIITTGELTQFFDDLQENQDALGSLLPTGILGSGAGVGTQPEPVFPEATVQFEQTQGDITATLVSNENVESVYLQHSRTLENTISRGSAIDEVGGSVSMVADSELEELEDGDVVTAIAVMPDGEELTLGTTQYRG